jgi:hypothetical protein
MYLILNTIFCSSELETKKHNCFIVTDRELKGLKMKHSSSTIVLPQTENKYYLKNDYLWESYFPKPIFYEVKYFNSKKLKSRNSFDLVGITGEDEIMFCFKLIFNYHQIILSDFLDSNNVPIINALFCSDEEPINIYMLSRESKNVDSIKSSLEYIILVDKSEPLYKELLNSLFRYIKNIENLSEDFKNFCDKSVLNRFCKAKNSLVSITITILRSQSSLRLPIFYKLDKIPIKKRFEVLLNELFGSLEEFVEIYLYNKNDEAEIELQKEDVLDFIKDKIIQNNLPSKCVQIYEKLLLNLENIDYHVNEVFYSRKTNYEILLDCNFKKVDRFIGAYSDLILSYCSFMRDSDDQLVFNSCLSYEASEIDDLIQKLKDFYVDKLISHRIMHFVRNYKDDNKDFLIFSQTDYFKYTLSSRIINNLSLLSTIKSIPNPEDETQEEFTEAILQIDQEYLDHVAKIEEEWYSTLTDDIPGKVKSFAEFI